MIAELPAYEDAWSADWSAHGTADTVCAATLAKRLRDPIWRHAPRQPWRTAFRYALGWWGLSLVRELVHRSGPEMAPTLAEALADLFAAVPLKAKRIARRNLRLVFPEAAEAWRRETLRRNLYEVVRTLMATVALERLRPHEVLEQVRTTGEAHLAAALDQGRGAVVLTGHYGPFPLGFTRLAAAGWPVAVIVRRQKDVVFEDHWKKLRDRFGVLSIPHQPARLSVGLALKHLRSGGLLYMAGDQKAPGEDYSVPFFGHKVHTHGLPARLSLHTGAPLLTAFVTFNEPSSQRMTLSVEPPLASPSCPPATCRSQSQEAVVELLRGYHRRLEAAIRRRPPAWWWLHNRFHRWPGHGP